MTSENARGAMATYLNACSHGLPSAATMQRMIDHLALEQRIGPVAAREAAEAGAAALREDAAALIGAAPADTGFSFTTFTAWSALLGGLDLAGRHVLVAPHEWGENVRALRALAAQNGMRIEIVPSRGTLPPAPEDWAARIGEDTAALFLPMVTSVQGLRYPVEAVAALPRPEGCRLILDAAQALGQTPVDVARLGCDALVGTGRKWLRGPRGSALFWLRPVAFPGLAGPPIERFDANVAVRLGLGQAIAEARGQGLTVIEGEIARLSAHALERAGAAGLAPFGDQHPRTGALCLAVPSARALHLAPRLAAEGFTVKWPDIRTDEPLAPAPPDGTALLRIAPHVYNTEAGIDALFERIAAGCFRPAGAPKR